MKDIKIIQGEQYTFTTLYTDYPSNSYTLHMALRSTVGKVDVTAVSNSDGTYTFDISGVDTALIKAGEYNASLYVTDADDNRIKVDECKATVELDYLSDGAVPVVSWSKATLDIVEKAIAGRATSQELNYTIAGTTIGKIPLVELMQLRDKLRNDVAAENFFSNPNQIKIVTRIN